MTDAERLARFRELMIAVSVAELDVDHLGHTGELIRGEAVGPLTPDERASLDAALQRRNAARLALHGLLLEGL